MFKDIWGQAWEAMLYNRRRTAITMIGMAWGIATVVLLLAYGAGFSRAIEAIFAEWGTNIIGVFPGRTSEQAGGDKAGVQVRFTEDDVDRIAERRSGNRSTSRRRCRKTYPCRTICIPTPGRSTASGPCFRTSGSSTSQQGRFFNGAEDQQRAHVCVIGSEAKTKLFSGGWAVGADHPAEWRPLHRSSACSRPKCRRANRATATGRSMCPSAP